MRRITVVVVGECSPAAVCVCQCAAELHEVEELDNCDGTAPIQYYAACTTQNCECAVFQELDQ